MRTTQFIGHTDEVLNFLKTCTKTKKINTAFGMFGEPVADLYEYIDATGQMWEEFLQFCPWSSGPMLFLAIRNKQTKKIKGWKPSHTAHCEFIDSAKGTFYV